MNDYKKLDSDTVAVILRDKNGIEKARTIIDIEDLDKVINSGYSWVPFRNNEQTYAIANTPEGRIYLNKFIMNTPEDMATHPINLNTLDNRKINFENKNVSEE